MIPFNGYIMIKDLSKTFDVTEETIRRDIIKLCEINPSIKKIHGGIFKTSSEDTNVPQTFRENLLTKEKSRFAEVCADIPEQDSCIMLDSSTTCHFIAQQLKLRNIRLQIVTNSLRTATLFSDSENVQVTLIGGRLRKSNASLVGAEAYHQIGRICADYCFISPTAVDLKYGATDNSSEEADVRESMIRNSKKSILVADHTKFGNSRPYIVSNLEAFDRIIADKATDSKYIEELLARGIKVISC